MKKIYLFGGLALILVAVAAVLIIWQSGNAETPINEPVKASDPIPEGVDFSRQRLL